MADAMKHSEVIRKAIDTRLWDGTDADVKTAASCLAVNYCDQNRRFASWGPVVAWMEDRFGDVVGTDVFYGIEECERRQLARALWLTLAAHIAEEEGQ